MSNVTLETSLKLDAFPLENALSYQPHSLELSVLGVGFNVARALETLGERIRFASIVGPDTVGGFVRAELQKMGMDRSYLHTGKRTGRSWFSQTLPERVTCTPYVGVHPNALTPRSRAASLWY